MKRFSRFFSVFLVLVVVVGSGGLYLWLRSSLPVTDGTLALPGLSAPVTITRDKSGVPTIKAQNDPDAAFALGFVHAQDRLFQMDLMRRFASGRLAEWFGARAVDSDRSMRVLGLYRAAEAQYALLSPALKAVFDAYAAGVNAFLATRRGAPPPEYVLLSVRPDSWTPADSLVWGKIMDLQLTGNYRMELLRQRLAQHLKPEEMAVLFPAYRGDAPIVLGQLDADLPGVPPQQAASNEWVVDGKHSVSGKPLLANDTHLGFSTPGVWYLARIETPDDTLSGVTSPGEPMVVLGHNTHIAWGFTTTGGDVEDLFVEKADPTDPAKYLTPDGTEPFMTRSETIKVRSGDPVTITTRATRHGPIISNPAAEGDALALSATWLQGDDHTPDALWGMTHAHDWDGFRAALRQAVAPEQNIVYADIDGNIGFFAPAQIPMRAAGNGFAPVPGWTGDHDWTGFVPFDAMPMGFNPPSGRFFAANNKIVPDSYPYFITNDWELPLRAERIGQLLDATQVQSPETSAAIQRDTVSLMARRLLPLMLTGTSDAPRSREVIRLLKAWDGKMDRDRVEPLLFTAWLREFNRQVIADKLGAQFESYWSLHPDVIESILTAHRDWCDDRDTPSIVETCEQQLGAALDRSLGELDTRYGGDMSRWKWGEAHRASFRHPIWPNIPVLGNWLALDIPDDGGYDTIDNASTQIGDESQPFAAIHGPTMRMIVDMAAPDAARFVVTPGQSGNVLSPHYADLMSRWRDVTYVGFSDDSAGGVLTLTPR